MAGKIIQLGDHQWTMPESPLTMDDVLFVRENKANQYWRRDTSIPKVFFDWHPFVAVNASKTSYNQEGLMETLSEEDTATVVRYRDREMNRRWEGVWFMNNGELEYLTGGHYFMLQWGAMPDMPNEFIPQNTGYGNFRKFQRDVHYVLEMVKKDKKTHGCFIGKAKKTGLTQLLSLDYVDESTKYKQKRFGMMSKTKPDNLRTNFMYFMYAYDRLPPIMQPMEAKRLEDMIRFDVPRKKSSTSKDAAIKRMMEAEGINSEVFAAPTVHNAFDGPKMFRAWNDELPKCEDPYPEDIFTASSETVKVGSVGVGKHWITSYAPEEDNKSFEQAKKIWEDSLERDVHTGETLTGIITYFISVLDSGEGKFDIFGNCDREATREDIMGKRAQRKNDKQKLQAYTRQYPIVSEEMWQVGGGSGSTWDNVRLGSQKDEVKRAEKLERSYVEGNLEWDGTPMESLLRFVPLTNEQILSGTTGNFLAWDTDFWHLYNFNGPLKRKLDGQLKLKPDEHSPFVAAWDPTDMVGAEEVTVGSKAAGMVKDLFDIGRDTYAGQPISNRVKLRYLNRHDNPHDDLKELIKMVLFCGCAIYIETNKPWMFTEMRLQGLGEFLMARDPAKGIVKYVPGGSGKLPNTDEKTIDNYIRLIAKYIQEVSPDWPIDYLKYIRDIEALDQLMKFKPNKTKKYDLAVCFGLLLIHEDAILATRRKKEGARKSNGGMATAMRKLVGDLEAEPIAAPYS